MVAQVSTEFCLLTEIIKSLGKAETDLHLFTINEKLVNAASFFLFHHNYQERKTSCFHV